MAEEKIMVPAWLDVEFHDAWADAMAKTNGAPGRALLVEEYFRTLQRLRETTEILRKDGVVAKSDRSGLKHLHPLLKIEKDLRAQALKYATNLGLHYCNPSI